MRRLFLLLPLLACRQSTVNAALGIAPAQAMTSPAALVQFAALGASPVAWSVVETGGGSVTSGGLYTAPACPTVGLFHVSVSAGGKTAQAAVTVADGVATLTISPSSVTLAPGQPQQFTATQTTGCGAVSSATMKITAPTK